MLAERVVVGRLVRLAVERHVNDLEHGHERGLHFNDEAAAHAVEFFGFLHHSKGEWAGQAFVLADWQAFVVSCVFGWMRADGERRFRQVYEEMSRKQGKSTKLAGIGLYGLVADGEPGAEIYTAATKRDQARISHSEAVRMVKASPMLSSRVRTFRDNLHIVGTASKFEPLGADSDTLDGLNVHMGLIDELHAHKSRGMYDILETATAARRQPLIWEVTTAGFDRNTICWEHHEHSIKVLEGSVEDDEWFAYIAALDEDDDWTDESVWVKANPNLGVSVKIEKLRSGCRKAHESLAYRNTFLRLHLNVWTQQSTKWIDMDVWEDNGQEVFSEADLSGLPCWGGLDLASNRDIAALVLVFPMDDDDGDCQDEDEEDA